jgi:hypothetical protein
VPATAARVEGFLAVLLEVEVAVPETKVRLLVRRVSASAAEATALDVSSAEDCFAVDVAEDEHVMVPVVTFSVPPSTSTIALEEHARVEVVAARVDWVAVLVALAVDVTADVVTARVDWVAVLVALAVEVTADEVMFRVAPSD